MTFGVLLPQGIYSELGSRPVGEHWPAMVAFAQRAEQLGFESLWVSDHLHPVFGPRSSDLYEAWTVLSAISQHTSRLRLGQLVLCNGFRNPAVLAKMAATLDIISGGRLILGLGAGWSDEEFRAYGLPFPSAAERLGQLRETLEAIRLLWSEPEVSIVGQHVTLAGAACYPKPLQTMPPILVGGVGRSLTLRLVAEYADIANFHGSVREFAATSACLDRHCEAVGRDPQTIRRTLLLTQTVIAESEQAIDEAVARLPLYGDQRPVRPRLCGTPPQVTDRLARYMAAGCTMAVLNPTDAPAFDSLELFATTVMPALSA